MVTRNISLDRWRRSPTANMTEATRARMQALAPSEEPRPLPPSRIRSGHHGLAHGSQPSERLTRRTTEDQTLEELAEATQRAGTRDCYGIHRAGIKGHLAAGTGARTPIAPPPESRETHHHHSSSSEFVSRTPPSASACDAWPLTRRRRRTLGTPSS